jgi:hypothetical protein
MCASIVLPQAMLHRDEAQCLVPNDFIEINLLGFAGRVDDLRLQDNLPLLEHGYIASRCGSHATSSAGELATQRPEAV